MAFKSLVILEKFGGAALETVTSTKSLTASTIIQPTYTFDLSMMYGVFIPEVSFGNTFYWLAGYIEASVASGIGDATLQYVDGSLAARDAFISKINSSIGYLDASLNVIYPLVFKENASIGWLDASIKALFSGAGASNASLNQIYPLVFKINSSLGQYTTNVSVNNTLCQYIKSSSIGDGLFWNTTTNKVDTSIALSKLKDVSIVNLTNNQVIQYRTDASKWLNRTPVSATDIFYTKDQIDSSKYIKEASLGTDFTWINGLLDVSIQGITRLDLLLDVSVVNPSTGDFLQYNKAILKWYNNYAVQIIDYFYTKTEVDDIIAEVLGGTY